MLLKFYLYMSLLVGGTIACSNIAYSTSVQNDHEVLTQAFTRGVRYGLIWPNTLMTLRDDFTSGKDWTRIFKPN